MFCVTENPFTDCFFFPDCVGADVDSASLLKTHPPGCSHVKRRPSNEIQFLGMHLCFLALAHRFFRLLRVCNKPLLASQWLMAAAEVATGEVATSAASPAEAPQRSTVLPAAIRRPLGHRLSVQRDAIFCLLEQVRESRKIGTCRCGSWPHAGTRTLVARPLTSRRVCARFGAVVDERGSVRVGYTVLNVILSDPLRIINRGESKGGLVAEL